MCVLHKFFYLLFIYSSSYHQSTRLYAYVLDSFWLDIQQFPIESTMASRQKRRTPHNIYTEKRAERDFRDFIQHAGLRNLPIPENLLSQATNTNRPSSPKRQRHTLLEVRSS